MKHLTKIINCVLVFSIAMGFLEAAVVIYLREMYYKDGFTFPLKPMSTSIVFVELLRELATIIMLICIGYVAGKTKLQRFAYFGLAFAVWDIFYYVFLYLFLDWPESLFTWDILFLIPVPWVGPVWAPCTLSMLMIVGSVFVIVRCHKNENYSVPIVQWLSVISGAIVCFVSFILDYFTYQQKHQAFLNNAKWLDDLSGYVPQYFNSLLFLTGMALMALPVLYSMFSSLIIKSNIKR
jgi:hypothetical protein